MEASWNLFSELEKKILKDLVVLNQTHIFDNWDELGINDDLKQSFAHQLTLLDESYSGGIRQYLSNAKRLLSEAKVGMNPLDGWIPSVPPGIVLEPLSDQFLEFEQKGLSELGHCGFVLVAGGLGERLGFNGIKLALPCDTVTHMSYIEYYCKYILAIQERFSSIELPLAIMVSDDTHQKTIDHLEFHCFFGMKPTQITILKQEKVPALMDNECRISMLSPYSMDTKPHGHGDVHMLMHSSGTVDKWYDLGIKWLYFFQDTNGLAFLSLPCQLGVSEVQDYDVNSMAVPRFPKQSLGAITKLTHIDGRSMTVNVEYNQLGPMLVSNGFPEGDSKDSSTGYSPYPGNINQLLFRMSMYHCILASNSGAMPEFVNPKYADATREKFKKATRLECMMQDFPKLLDDSYRVGFTVVPEWFGYSPCKNKTCDAVTLVRSGVPAGSAFTAESSQYFVWCELLRRLGANVPSSASVVIEGIESIPSPRLIFQPSFALCASDLLHRFPSPPNIIVEKDSTLVVGGNVVIKRLTLNGSLFIEGGESNHDVNLAQPISNQGHKLISINEYPHKDALEEIDTMRGYKIDLVESERLRFY